MKVLIAYDGSEYSEAALLDLGLAGLPPDLDAFVVSVSERWLPPPSTEEVLEPGDDASHSRTVEDASGVAERARQELTAAFPGWNISAVAYKGSPAEQILEKAEEWRPDLVVVGSQGHTALGRFVIGSVSQKVVTEAACSVRVVRRRPGDRARPPRLLIGLDGSPQAQEAVRTVSERRWPEGTEVLILTIFDESLERSPHFDKELGRIDMVQWDAESILSAAGLTPSRLSLEGNPKRRIPDKAESWEADCIFVGRRGHGRLRRLMLGSVASAVAARAYCSVEVCRAPRS